MVAWLNIFRTSPKDRRLSTWRSPLACINDPKVCLSIAQNVLQSIHQPIPIIILHSSLLSQSSAIYINYNVEKDSKQTQSMNTRIPSRGSSPLRPPAKQKKVTAWNENKTWAFYMKQRKEPSKKRKKAKPEIPRGGNIDVEKGRCLFFPCRELEAESLKLYPCCSPRSSFA